jgi:hypothetical protein
MQSQIDTRVQQAITYHSIIADCDELAHVEDTPLFTAIRGGVFVEVTWNELTDAERRAAYVNAFYPCSWEEVY